MTLQDRLKCLNKESINLLHKNQLLKSLLKSELIQDVLSEIEVDQEVRRNLISSVLTKQGIEDNESYLLWLAKNNLNKYDFENLVLGPYKKKIFCKQKFLIKEESYFLQRKNDLDVISYSLIRVKDQNLCRELYIQINDGESQFEDIASKYSLGPEKDSKGFVGTFLISQSHPTLTKIFRTCKKGEVTLSQIDDFHIITRLDSYQHAQLNEEMREKLREEMFEEWINKQVNDLHESIFSTNAPIKTKKQEEIIL